MVFIHISPKNLVIELKIKRILYLELNEVREANLNADKRIFKNVSHFCIRAILLSFFFLPYLYLRVATV